MNESHEVRELRRRLHIANKTMGRQGRTIATLRGELARTREEHSKIERGELRRLQRFEATALELIDKLEKRAERAHDEIQRLHEKLDAK